MKKTSQFAAFILAVLLLNNCKKEAVIPVQAYTTESELEAGGGKANNAVFNDVVYGRNTDWLGKATDLKLDIYLPVPEVTKNKFPLIVYMHGGGFLTGDKRTSQDDCEILNANGFIAATINYRLGRDQKNNACAEDPDLTSEACYRAIQDLRASIRYLVANAGKYGIDTRWIFIEGASAGAATCLEAAYITQDSADYYFSNSSKKLGLLNNAGNNLPDNYTIRGIASMWGALYSQYIITRENAIPTIFFHGELDDIMPWNIGHFYNCDNLAVDYGSKPIYERLTSFNVPAVAHIDPQGSHGVYDKQFCEENIACFFNSIIRGQTQKGWYTTPVSNCR